MFEADVALELETREVVEAVAEVLLHRLRVLAYGEYEKE
jgi:hypothetical protein